MCVDPFIGKSVPETCRKLIEGDKRLISTDINKSFMHVVNTIYSMYKRSPRREN